MEKRLLTPRDYGLPDKFTAWRPGQHDIIESIRANTKRISMLSAPVGSGKSAIAVASGIGRRTLYLCTTKQLQDQLQADFPNAVVLKGRGNYVCLKNPNILTAEHCTRSRSKRDCKKCGYTGWCEGHRDSYYDGRCACESECEYLTTKEAALNASLAVLNIQLFMTEANMVGGFSGWPYVVADECDLVEGALLSYVDLTITKHNIETLHLEPPKYKTKPESWIEWMNAAIPKCEDALESLQGAWTPSNLKLETTLARMLSKIKFASHEIPNGNWVFIPEDEKWSFKPVFVSKYAANALWRHCNNVLMMSATLVNPQQLCRDIGLDKNNAEVFEMGSSFPIESRRVIFRPAAYLTFKKMENEFPKVVAGLDDVLDAHPDVKALVHAVSYTNAREILRLSKHRNRMITHENSVDKDTALERFKQANYPAVMVSPSMDRGVDLYGELCRVVVIVKCPYASLKDKQIAARVYGAKDGNEWYATNTIRSIVQASGRATRSADDWSVTYILDGQFAKLYWEYAKVFPKWWRDALVMGETKEEE
jgi:Rad3-related DNA helicase